ncbi:hypothetical protein [Actinoplanes sp. OR16]|uniref:hypothetical protein n=1 Tax=Actinoplanes sp. OR16 TaxID=946334 RepID=UPI0011AEEBFF|nr:hypothetical protein [Actinoplanes sp. OR16]
MRTALLMTVALTCVACSDPAEPSPETTTAPETSTVSTPTEPTAVPPTATAPPTGTAPATDISPTTGTAPAKTATLPKKQPAGDPAEPSTWLTSLADCPNEGQKAEIQDVLRKDATGDGVTDTLIARTCEASTSYIPSTVEIFDGVERIAVLLEDVGPTDLPWYRSMAVDGETVTVVAYGVSEGGVPACPDLKLTYTYQHANGTFTRTGRQETKVDDLCLPVG